MALMNQSLNMTLFRKLKELVENLFEVFDLDGEIQPAKQLYLITFDQVEVQLILKSWRPSCAH